MRLSLLYTVARQIGIDKAIAYSSLARIAQGVTGVGSVFFIATFLTNIEQGFYYAFASILALQVFFELGLTGIISQYFSHEVVHLKLNSNLRYEGDDLHLSRLASLLNLFVKWYFILSIVCFVLLTISGFAYFECFGTDQAPEVEWRGPWMLICIGTAVKLFQSPFSAALQGLGYVKEISKIGFIQQIMLPLIMWLGLCAGLHLYVMGIGYILSVIMWFVFAYRNNLIKILKNLYEEIITERVSYWNEIFPFQWRIALSWISGYFIFQLFVPILFATEGAVVAGQMGLSLQALSAIQSLSLCWMNTKVPLLSGLIAESKFHKLDMVFFKTLRQMVIICSILLASFLLIVWIMKLTKIGMNGNIFGDRFLDLLPLILMCIPIWLNQFVGSWATYLRCHKKEPFLAISIVTGISCLCSTYFLGNSFGLFGMVIGYCTITVGSFFWGHYVFLSKKKEWHNT